MQGRAQTPCAGSKGDVSAMPISDPASVPPPPPQLRRWSAALVLLDAIADRLDRVSGRFVSRVGDGVWEFLHLIGAHRWREGWETNLERGWRQYRGSRCTICDAPWEGW
jgi:hypothetical protein